MLTSFACKSTELATFCVDALFVVLRKFVQSDEEDMFLKVSMS